MVNGWSGSSLLQTPYERKPVSCVRRASLVKPPTLTVCAELDGHSDMRPRPGRSTAVVESERAVPHQGVVEVVEPRTVVGDAKHVAAVRPLGADGEVVRPGVVGQRHFDVVAEPEAGAPGQFAHVPVGRERRLHVELRRWRGDEAHVADVPTLHADRTAGRAGRTPRELACAVLDRPLRRIVEARAARRELVIRRFRVDAVELGNLIPEAGDDEPCRSARSPPKYRWSRQPRLSARHLKV